MSVTHLRRGARGMKARSRPGGLFSGPAALALCTELGDDIPEVSQPEYEVYDCDHRQTGENHELGCAARNDEDQHDPDDHADDQNDVLDEEESPPLNVGQEIQRTP